MKDSIKDSTLNTYTYGQVRDTSGGRGHQPGGGGGGKGAARKPPKTTGFDAGSLANTNSKCHICTKTVYAMEFVGASGKAFHKNCFRCTVCTGKLRPDTYATMDDTFYCKTHYDEAFKKAGGYNFSKLDEAADAGNDAKGLSGELTSRPSQRAAGGAKSRMAAALAGFGSSPTTYETPGSTIAEDDGGDDDDDLLPDSLDAIDGVAAVETAPVETPSAASPAVVNAGTAAVEVKPLKVPAMFTVSDDSAVVAAKVGPRPPPMVFKFKPRTMFNGLQGQSTTGTGTNASSTTSSQSDAGAASEVEQPPVLAAAAVMRSLGVELQSSSSDDVGPIQAAGAGERAHASAETSTTAGAGAGAGSGGGVAAAAAAAADDVASLDRALALPEDAPLLKKRLRQSVRTGTLDEGTALSASRFVDGELRKLVAAIQKHGATVEGKCCITYGALAAAAVDDFESLVGLLRTAKKQAVVAYKAAMLMRGVHDGIVITLLTETIADSDLDTYTFKQIRHVSCRATHAATVPEQGAVAAALATEIMEDEAEERAPAPARAPALAPSPANNGASDSGKPPPLQFSEREMVLPKRRGSTIPEQEQDAVIDVLSSLVALASPMAEDPDDDDDDDDEEEEDEDEGDEDEGEDGDHGHDEGEGGADADGDVGGGGGAAGQRDAEEPAAAAAAATPTVASGGKPKAMTAVAAAAAAVEGQDGTGAVLASAQAPAPAKVTKPPPKAKFGTRPPTAHKAWGQKSKRAKPPLSSAAAAQSTVENAFSIPEDAPVLHRTLAASVRRGELSANRALLAARWVDKEIRKLIGLVVEHGSGAEGSRVITYGELFKLAEDSMEALSGTLKTAKKQKVVKFEAEMLFQGQSDAVVITLLKDSIPDSDATTYTYKQVRNVSRRIKPRKPPTTSGFGGASLANSNSKCHICTKTVYAMEFTGASGKAFHKNCFRCKVCNGKLKQDTYATVNDALYCKSHYDALFQKCGTYNFPDEAVAELTATVRGT